MKKHFNIYVIDLFAGAGGTTTGIHRAQKMKEYIAKVIYCINHSAVAISSHKLNHHDTIHIIEDIRTVNLMGILERVNEIRANDPFALIFLWASPDCTGHSLANGNKKKNPDSRSIANAIIRYAKILKPDYIQVENVSEFLKWGPCDKEGTPIKELQSIYYHKWKHRIIDLGYKYQHRELAASDFGAYTIRTRYFGIFAKPHLPIVFPIPTHSNTVSQDLFNQYEPYKKVRDILDLNNHGHSIFTKSKVRSDKTFKRILIGCNKFYKPRIEQFFLKYQGKSTVADINLPAPTLTTKDRLALIKVEYINNNYGASSFTEIDSPIGSLTANPKQELLTIEAFQYLSNPQYGNPGWSIDRPCFTLIARMDKAPVELITATMGYREQELREMLEHSSGYKAQLIEFMIKNGISDIKKRMLTIEELLEIQGFGRSYQLVGTETEKKKMIGNAVHPLIPKNWYEAIYDALLENYDTIIQHAA